MSKAATSWLGAASAFIQQSFLSALILFRFWETSRRGWLKSVEKIDRKTGELIVHLWFFCMEFDWRWNTRVRCFVCFCMHFCWRRYLTLFDMVRQWNKNLRVHSVIFPSISGLELPPEFFFRMMPSCGRMPQLYYFNNGWWMSVCL